MVFSKRHSKIVLLGALRVGHILTINIHFLLPGRGARWGRATSQLPSYQHRANPKCKHCLGFGFLKAEQTTPCTQLLGGRCRVYGTVCSAFRNPKPWVLSMCVRWTSGKLKQRRIEGQCSGETHGCQWSLPSSQWSVQPHTK